MTRSTGRDAFLSILADEGVTHVFGNPGTTELAIMEALGEQDRLRFVLGLQESIVLAMADGYARACGRITACNVHVAPGLGNAMGALYSAAFCRSPVIVTAGQQEQGHGLQEPLLYGPLVEMARPLAKWAVEVTRAEDLPRILRRAAKIATAPPCGPVFISLPGDVLDATTEADFGCSTRVERAMRPADEALDRLAQRVMAAERPVILAGTELATHAAWAEAVALAETLGAPVYQQSVPDAAHFPSEHPAYMGTLPRDQKKVNDTLAAHDLAIWLGGDSLRMSVYSPADPLPAGMPVVHVTEAGWDLGKNFAAEFALQANVKETLLALLPRLRARQSPTQAAAAKARLAACVANNWASRRARLAAEFEQHASASPIDHRLLMKRIADTVPADAIVVEEALTATPSLLSMLRYRDPQGFMGMASGGIGFAVPGAVGAALGVPGRPVVAVVGDGSAMYSIQALWTAANARLPVTWAVVNNSSYRILKERMVSFRGKRSFGGMDMRKPAIDFVALAQSLGVKAVRVADPKDIDGAMREATAAGEPRLIDFQVQDGFGG